MKRVGLLCAALLLALVVAQPAAAQDDYYTNAFRVQVVNEQISEQDIDFHLTGFGIRYSRFVHRNVALAGEYGASFGEPFGLDTTNQWVVGGLQLYAANTEAVQVYVQVLGGFDHISFGEGQGNSDTSGTLLFGGGLNLFPHPNVGFNAEINYKRTWLFDSGQNTVQYRGGLTFRWGGQ